MGELRSPFKDVNNTSLLILFVLCIVERKPVDYEYLLLLAYHQDLHCSTTQTDNTVCKVSTVTQEVNIIIIWVQIMDQYSYLIYFISN